MIALAAARFGGGGIATVQSLRFRFEIAPGVKARLEWSSFDPQQTYLKRKER